MHRNPYQRFLARGNPYATETASPAAKKVLSAQVRALILQSTTELEMHAVSIENYEEAAQLRDLKVKLISNWKKNEGTNL